MTSSEYHSVKILSTTADYSLVAMVTDLCRDLSYDSMGAWHTVYVMLLSNREMLPCMPCSYRIVSEMLPEIYRLEKFDFLKSITHSPIINPLL